MSRGSRRRFLQNMSCAWLTVGVHSNSKVFRFIMFYEKKNRLRCILMVLHFYEHKEIDMNFWSVMIYAFCSVWYAKPSLFIYRAFIYNAKLHKQIKPQIFKLNFLYDFRFFLFSFLATSLFQKKVKETITVFCVPNNF